MIDTPATAEQARGSNRPVWIVGGVLLAVAAVAQFQVGGITWYWGCEDYAVKKAVENIEDGYRPYDSYDWAGLVVVGVCTPTYSTP